MDILWFSNNTDSVVTIYETNLTLNTVASTHFQNSYLTLVGFNKKDNTVQVQVGIMKITAKAENLLLAEEEKGNALVKETFPLLKECDDINFIGSIEARDIPNGMADVVVCEAFVGNVILKLYEGVGSVLIKKVKQGIMTTLRSKIGALLVKPALKKTLKSFDASEYGGAPLLGLNGLVVKTHGSSMAKEVSNSIIQCVTFKKQRINDKIRECIRIKEKE